MEIRTNVSKNKSIISACEIHKDCLLFYLYLFIACFMKISLQSSKQILGKDLC